MTLAWHIGCLSGHRYYFKEGGGAGFTAELLAHAQFTHC
jgi:hypothetical protein